MFQATSHLPGDGALSAFACLLREDQSLSLQPGWAVSGGHPQTPDPRTALTFLRARLLGSGLLVTESGSHLPRAASVAKGQDWCQFSLRKQPCFLPQGKRCRPPKDLARAQAVRNTGTQARAVCAHGALPASMCVVIDSTPRPAHKIGHWVRMLFARSSSRPGCRLGGDSQAAPLSPAPLQLISWGWGVSLSISLPSH